MKAFTASDGGVIAYREEGPRDPSARPVVLLHGLMAHGGFFRAQAPLAEEFRIITLDLRGHGRSGVNGANVERAAADVAELVEALDLGDAVGVGWSLGATILWHVLAGPAATRFAGAVVVDMTARVRNAADWDLGLTAEACEARSLAIRDDYRAFAINAGQAIFAQPVDEARRAAADWASAEFARNDPAAIAELWASLEEQDLRPLLSQIRHPTLIVHGAQSQLYGADTADHLVGALPNARSVRFSSSGHAPHLEEPALFNRTVKEFAASLPPVTSKSDLRNRRIG
ncbi:MAG: alpha/beta hydrolase [Alphaproteobacteria bacterium]|nr:alpha/beta hydrolase [Alphaproteobacteria bacterium]